MRTSCVVTGGARGIGRGIAERMVARGHAVVVTDVDGDAARRTAVEIGAAEGLAQDVRDRESHARVADAAGRHGTLTVWFNNAGVGDDGRLSEMTDEALDRLIDVNVRGVMHGTRAALAAFGEAGGDVVNTASLAGLGPVPGYTVYAATKAAVVSMTASVNAETPTGVRVHAICPDVVDTVMLREGHTAGSLGSSIAHSGGRILSVAEVADAAVSLVGSNRVVLSIPAHRGGLVRLSATMPGVSSHAMGLFAALGRRAVRRQGG